MCAPRLLAAGDVVVVPPPPSSSDQAANDAHIFTVASLDGGDGAVTADTAIELVSGAGTHALGVPPHALPPTH